jgi:hypothetical protein
MPLTLLIIRHAEKPDGAWPGPGLTDSGVSDVDSLVIRGWQRAGSWAALFGTKLGGTDYPTPAAIYAADPRPPGVSKRPAQTVSAVAARLKLPTNYTYAKGQEKDLVKALLTLSGVVLVGWEHEAIVQSIVPLLTPVLSGKPPTQWDGSRFDVVLRYDRADGTNGFVFRELFPMLMSGDSNTPL